MLIKEFFGTLLAAHLGLRTFDFNIMVLGDADEIPLGRDGRSRALPGPAFVTRAEKGTTWSGSENELKSVENRDMVTRLVIFDMLTLNTDRYLNHAGTINENKENVFLSEESSSRGMFSLVAMDFTHCLLGGQSISSTLNHDQNVKSDKLYGLFPAFNSFLKSEAVDDILARIKSLKKQTVGELLEAIPYQWGLRDDKKKLLGNFVIDRGRFLVENVKNMIWHLITEQQNLFLRERGE